MSIKSKIAIVLIVIMLVLFGFSLSGIAATPTNVVDVSGVTDLEDLARLAAKSGLSYQDKFLSIGVSSLKGKYIKQGSTSAEYEKVIGYKSGLCISKSQSSDWSSDDYYQICNVIDFDYSTLTNKFTIKNNRNYCYK